MPFEIKNGVRIERVVTDNHTHISESPSGKPVLLQSYTSEGFVVYDGKKGKKLREVHAGDSYDLFGSRSAVGLQAAQVKECLLEIRILRREPLGNS